MSTPPFVHLHCHSHFSLLDGASPIQGLIDRAKSLNMSALALTNVNGGFGFVLSGSPFTLQPFTSDASVNISADAGLGPGIPEPTSLVIALLGERLQVP